MAASYYGIPRTTLDADFLIHISPRRSYRLLRGLREVSIEVDLEKVRRQLRSGYNIVTVTDKLSPHTADLIITQHSPEKREGMVQGIKAYFQSPEALILAKLRMIKATRPVERSQKDRDDVRAILASTKIDRKKIAREAKRETTLIIFQQLAE